MKPKKLLHFRILKLLWPILTHLNWLSSSIHLKVQKGGLLKQREVRMCSIKIREKFPKSGSPSMIQGAINDCGRHRYFWNAESLGWFRLIWSISITPAWSTSIISIYHTPVISSHDWGTIFSCWLCAREFEIFMGSERTEGVQGLHARQKAIGGGDQTKSDFNFVKRIVLKFEMVKNVTLVG